MHTVLAYSFSVCYTVGGERQCYVKPPADLITARLTPHRQKGKTMDTIDYTKVTADAILQNCRKCEGKHTLSVLLFINETGEVIAYDHDGCYVCESN